MTRRLDQPATSPNWSGCVAHDWGCPVLMKLDPQRVAWTCKCCGAIVACAAGEAGPIQPTQPS